MYIGDILEAMWFISHAKVSVCSTSTFCFWAAMVRNNLIKAILRI